jgi:PmbA protein
LDTKIGNDRLTLHSVPVSDKLDKRYYITNDGFKAENSILIRNGILKSYALSLYGANKTGKKRALNNSDSYYMEPGNVSYNEIIKNTKRGILLCRYSGGRPNPNGDFSVVAKNSFYIENGIVRYPLNETMISGNLKDMIMNIKEISKESINFGDAVLPWISMSGFTISGR